MSFIYYFYINAQPLEIKVKTDLNAEWTRIRILVDTACNFRIESFILCNDERVLHCSEDTS